MAVNRRMGDPAAQEDARTPRRSSAHRLPSGTLVFFLSVFFSVLFYFYVFFFIRRFSCSSPCPLRTTRGQSADPGEKIMAGRAEKQAIK